MLRLLLLLASAENYSSVESASLPIGPDRLGRPRRNHDLHRSLRPQDFLPRRTTPSSSLGATSVAAHTTPAGGRELATTVNRREVPILTDSPKTLSLLAAHGPLVLSLLPTDERTTDHSKEPEWTSVNRAAESVTVSSSLLTNRRGRVPLPAVCASKKKLWEFDPWPLPLRPVITAELAFIAVNGQPPGLITDVVWLLSRTAGTCVWKAWNANQNPQVRATAIYNPTIGQWSMYSTWSYRESNGQLLTVDSQGQAVRVLAATHAHASYSVSGPWGPYQKFEFSIDYPIPGP